MMKNIKGILFDMDGTILDSEQLFEKAQIALLKDYNIEINRKKLSEFKGMSYKDFYPRFIKKFNIDSKIELLRSKLRIYLHERMEKNLKYINGFESFYKTILKNSNIKRGLVTNTTRQTYQKIQSCINIDNYFKSVVTATEAKRPKPSPIPYLQAMNELNLNTKNTLIIEDSKTGLVSAVKTKAKVFGITTSLSAEQIKAVHKKIIIVNSYDHIKEKLKNQLSV